MQVFEIRTNRSNYPFLVIANGFKKAIETLYQKGIYDSNIIRVQQMEVYKSDHILIEKTLTNKEELRKEVTAEVLKDMPKWQHMPDGIAGGSTGRDIYLIRTAEGYYITSSCIGGDNYYLVLDTLEQLPGLPKED